jgi:hypothetical protein
MVNWVRLCKSDRFEGNAGDHWSEKNPSLDTFRNPVRISPVAVEFCAVGAIVVFYVSGAENVKRVFDSRVKFELSRRSSYYFEQLRNVTVIF